MDIQDLKIAFVISSLPFDGTNVAIENLVT